MAGMYGTPSSLLTGMPSDSDDFSTIFTHLLHTSPSKPKTLPPPWGTTGFFHSGDTHRLGQLGSDSGLDHPLKNGKSVGSSDALANASSGFDFSDPYAYVPADLKEATGNELFPTGIDDSDENTSFKEHRISPENDAGDFTSPVEKNTEASRTKQIPSRSSSKRSRAAEVHNLSEKRRRSRINEKMKALQNLIPNSNKTDKASMLDEAIEYLKQLQLQVQMLMMRNGLSLHPMCLPGGLQPMTLPQTGLNFDEANAESLLQPDFTLPKHCVISDKPAIIPSMPNTANRDTSSSFKFHVGHFDPSTPSKNALCDGTPQLHFDATKIEENPSSDVS